MAGFTFSANRFNQEPAAEPEKGTQSPSRAEISRPVAHSAILAKSAFYNIAKLPAKLPTESILECSITEDACVFTTDSQIIVARLNGGELSRYTVDFNYESNEFGVLPRSRVIPNSATPAQPDLVIVDGVRGTLRYIESLKLVPSLNTLQNEHELQLKLSRGEFITICEYSREFGVMLATNYRRVVLVTLKDQFGRTQLRQNEVIASKVIFSVFKSLNATVESYEVSNKVMGMKFAEVSSTRGSLAVVEEQGLVSVVDFIKGTGHSLVAQADMREVIGQQDILLKAVDSIGVGKWLVLGSTGAGQLFVCAISFAGNSVSVDSSCVLKSVCDKYPRLSVAEGYDTVFVVSGQHLVFCNWKTSWEDFVSLGGEAEVYGLSDLQDSSELIVATSKGLIQVQITASGVKPSPEAFVKSRIEQFLRFQTSESPVKFDLIQEINGVSSTDVEKALASVLREIVSGESSLLGDHVGVAENLQFRADLANRLAVFASGLVPLFVLSQSLKMLLANSVEVLSLASKFYDYVSSHSDKDGWHELVPPKEFFLKTPSQIVQALHDFVSRALASKVGNEISLVRLASLLNEVLSSAYITLERDVKCGLLAVTYDSSLATDSKLQPVFVDHLAFLRDVNGIVRQLTQSYGSQLDEGAESELRDQVTSAVLGLSLFLYYTTSDALQFIAATDRSASSFSSFYSANRGNWIQIFVLLHKQDEMIKLVEGFDDLDSLAELLESERQFVESEADNLDPIEVDNMAAEVETKFDSYFSKYDYSFAQALFGYYVSSGRQDLLLTRFTGKYDAYLRRFINSDPLHGDFSWILDVQEDKYASAADRLVSYASHASDKSVYNKELGLNIAKLCVLAEDGTGQLQDMESHLAVIRLQKRYSRSLEAFEPSSALAELPLLRNHVSSLFEDLSTGIELSLFDTVDLVSSVFSPSGFEDLLTLLSQLYAASSSSSSHVISLSAWSYPERLLSILISLTFKRLILAEDWDYLSDGIDMEQSRLLGVLSDSSSYSFSSPKSISQLLLSQDDLEYLGVSESLSGDYFEENEHLKTLNGRYNVDKILGV